MQTVSQNLDELFTLWKQTHQLETAKALSNGLKISDVIASFFCPGDFYYFIFNFYDFSFEYIHQDVQKVIGCAPEDFSLDLLFQLIHPDDLTQFKLKEEAAREFFYFKIPPEKIPSYKSTYTFRVRSANDQWKTLLQQTITLQLTENRIHYVLCVHSDITFLNPAPDDRISFVGINGEPSFYSQSTVPGQFLQPAQAPIISKREKEVIRLLAEGLSSKQIAGRLFVSQHTVDTHRRNLLKKTGAQNTLELVANCVKKGLI